MKILIIGDSLEIVGGVPNYTKPLFKNIEKIHKDTYYLFTNSYLKEYSFFKKTGIKNINSNVYVFDNCPILAKNYRNPLKEVSNIIIEKELSKFLIDKQITVVHIHSMLGLTSSIYKLIINLNIKLFVTIHEYWWLCPHQVMVDFNKKICEGPLNIQKCSFCVNQIKTNKSDYRIKTIAKIKNDFPYLFRLMFNTKKRIAGKNGCPEMYENIEFLNLDWQSYHNYELEDQLSKRLMSNIKALNYCNKIIAVSNDVRNILEKYGVEKERILVQHIGSTISEKTIPHVKKINSNEIVFGFIGGVSYYKGVHQLVNAFIRLPRELKLKSFLKIYGKYSESYYNTIMRDLIIDDEDKNRITFYGRFTSQELPEITNQIDISVLPSLCADTAPQTIFESFSCGLPIIAPNVGGFPDFIKNEVNGLIYEAANVESLKSALSKIIQEPEKLALYSKNIPKIKTLTKNIEELLEIYNS